MCGIGNFSSLVDGSLTLFKNFTRVARFEDSLGRLGKLYNWRSFGILGKLTMLGFGILGKLTMSDLGILGKLTMSDLGILGKLTMSGFGILAS